MLAAAHGGAALEWADCGTGVRRGMYGAGPGDWAMEAGNLNPGTCLEGRHVIDLKARNGLHVAAQAHRRVEPIPRRARNSGLGAVGEQDGFATLGLAPATASECLCNRGKKTAQRVRFRYAPGRGLRIVNVYNAISKTRL